MNRQITVALAQAGEFGLTSFISCRCGLITDQLLTRTDNERAREGGKLTRGRELILIVGRQTKFLTDGHGQFSEATRFAEDRRSGPGSLQA